MKLGRLLRHRWYDETDAHRALKPEALDRIERRIAASERLHSGEIRVCVEAGLPLSYLWRDATPRERAIAMFGKLRVWDTERNNGVLIYLLLADHAIEIVADRAIHARFDAGEWRQMLDAMQGDFRAGRFEDGLMKAIERLDVLLRENFPLDPDAKDAPVNVDELPNRPVLR